MRSIGRLEDKTRASVFSDFLYSTGVANEVREDDGVFAVWVHDDAQLATAKEHLADYLSDPTAERFAKAGSVARQRRKEAEAEDKAYARRLANARRSLTGADGRGWLTLSLLAVSLLVAAYTNLGTNMERVAPFMVTEYPWKDGFPEIATGQLWRIFTPGIVHFGMMHLGFNLMMWWGFAQRIEVRKGFAFTALLVASAQVVSGLVQIAWTVATMPHGYVFFGGLSGVLYALFGYAWTKGRIDPSDRIGVSDNTVYFLMGWLFLCMTGILGNIANGAHVGGLLWGGAYAYLERAWFNWQKRRGP